MVGGGVTWSLTRIPWSHLLSKAWELLKQLIWVRSTQWLKLTQSVKEYINITSQCYQWRRVVVFSDNSCAYHHSNTSESTIKWLLCHLDSFPQIIDSAGYNWSQAAIYVILYIVKQDKNAGPNRCSKKIRGNSQTGRYLMCENRGIFENHW